MKKLLIAAFIVMVFASSAFANRVTAVITVLPSVVTKDECPVVTKDGTPVTGKVVGDREVKYEVK